MFSRKFIQKLKKNNNIVLSYLSIGEAESYRFYFKNMNKKILIKENPNWKENFVIHFQHPEWKEIIYRGENSYLSQIKKIGFDGVYLDRIDVFEEFKDYQNQAKKMADFVIDLSKYAKKINPEFIVVAQNASNIINYLSDKDQYLNSIDGLAIEDLFYLGNKKHDNDYKPQTEVLKEIKFYKRKNIKIFSVEYLKDIKKIKKYKKLAKKYGLVHLIANRALSGD
jgi:cysteinyl-tRNA synthetase